jgi:predicted MPP superfamily phosphohydrolase
MKLEVGYSPDFEVRQVDYACAGAGSFTVLYLSDLHLTRFGGPLVARLIATITQLDPQLVLLGGDYLDGPRGVPHFNRLLEFLAARPHVFVVAGNHDEWFGLTKIRQLVEHNNLTWLGDETVVISLDGYQIALGGKGASGRPAGVAFSILCLHQPDGLPQLSAGHDLVLAGHLHGGQVVLWHSARGLYPGRLFYRWNILQARLGQCLCIISKGLGDTLPLRYNCPKDVVLVQVNPARPATENPL